MQNYFVHQARREFLMLILALGILFCIGMGTFIWRDVALRNAHKVPAYSFLISNSDNLVTTEISQSAGNINIAEHGLLGKLLIPGYQYFLNSLSSSGFDVVAIEHGIEVVLNLVNCLLLFFVIRRYFGGRTILSASLSAGIYLLIIDFLEFDLSKVVAITILLGIVCLQKYRIKVFRLKYVLVISLLIGLSVLLKAWLLLLLLGYSLWWLFVGRIAPLGFKLPKMGGGGMLFCMGGLMFSPRTLHDSSINQRRFRILIFLLAIAFFLRIGAGFLVEEQVAVRNANENITSPFLFPDSDNMHSTAANLRAGNGYIDNHDRLAWRMPLYQFFLAGLSYLGFSAVTAIRGFQAILDTFNCFLLFVVTRRNYGGRAGLFAAAMAAIYPMFIYFSALVLTESMTITAILLIVYTQTRLGAGFNLERAFIAGIMIGIGTLVKASLAPMIAAYILWWVITRRKAPYGYKRVLAAAACMLLGMGLILTPWILRNYSGLDAFVPLRTASGDALYESNSEFADGGPNNNKIVFPPGADALGEVERDQVLRQAAFQWIKDNPKRFLQLGVKKFTRTWSPLPNFAGAQAMHYKIALFCSYVPVMLLAFYGLWRMRSRWHEAWMPLVPVITIALMHTVVMGSIRYRIPVMVCVMMFSGKGLSSLTRRWIDQGDDNTSYLK